MDQVERWPALLLDRRAIVWRFVWSTRMCRCVSERLLARCGASYGSSKPSRKKEELQLKSGYLKEIERENTTCG
jgi:hypothetical protein